MLAAPSVIPATPDLKELPPFDADITLDDEFINKYIKSKGQLKKMLIHLHSFVRITKEKSS